LIFEDRVTIKGKAIYARGFGARKIYFERILFGPFAGQNIKNPGKQGKEKWMSESEQTCGVKRGFAYHRRDVKGLPLYRFKTDAGIKRYLSCSF